MTTKPKRASQKSLSNLQGLVTNLANNKALKPKSLISTIFGDMIVPIGGHVWVDTLCTLLEPLGVSERLVRTSLFRMTEGDWLKSTRSGRRSFYGLTSLGRSQTKLAESLIYHRNDFSWNGAWTIVFLVMKPVNKQARQQLEEELSWIGFGRVSNHAWAHPTVAAELVLERVNELDLQDKVVCMRCENVHNTESGFKLSDRDLALACMPVTGIQSDYQRFITNFDGILNSIEKLNVDEMLSLRILLIDQYRKIILEDPHLPKELLPTDWNGKQAYSLAAQLYESIKAKTDKRVEEILNESGEITANHCSGEYSNRFNN